MCIILLIVFALLRFFVNKCFNKERFYQLSPLLLFFVLSSVSMLYSSDTDNAVKMLTKLLPFALFPFIFSVLYLKKDSYVRLLKLYVFWMLLVCFYSHTQVLIKLQHNNDILYNIFNSHYSYLSLSKETIGLHSTYYAYYVLLATIFTTSLLLNSKKRIIQFGYLVIIAYFTFFIFHLSARLPIAVLFLFFNLAIIYYFFKQKQLIKGAVILLLFYFISGIVVYNVRITRYRFQHLAGFTYSDGTQHDDGVDKILQWKAAAVANTNLVFGNGIGDADQSIFDSYLNYGLDKYKDRAYNAHNQFIQSFVSLGLIGVVCLLFIFVYYIKLFHRHKQLLPSVILALTFILFQTESYLQRHNGIVMFSFLICLFLQYSQKNPDEDPSLRTNLET